MGIDAKDAAWITAQALPLKYSRWRSGSIPSVDLQDVGVSMINNRVSQTSFARKEKKNETDKDDERSMDDRPTRSAQSEPNYQIEEPLDRGSVAECEHA